MLSAVQAIILIRHRISANPRFPLIDCETCQEIEGICEATVKGVNENYWSEKYRELMS